MLKIKQIKLIRKKFYIDASIRRILEIGLMGLSKTIVVNLMKKKQKVYFMISLQNNFLFFTGKNYKNWDYNFRTYHRTTCIRRLRELKKSINLSKKWIWIKSSILIFIMQILF